MEMETRAVFCGNIEYGTRERDVERLFRRYGCVERVDLKHGFAFIYMEDDMNAHDAIRALNRIEFGRNGCRLRVEWTKGDSTSRRSLGRVRPAKTLFVKNFDGVKTRIIDFKRHFESYGKIDNVDIWKNSAFVHYESLEDSIKAFESTNSRNLLGLVIRIEYAENEKRIYGNQNPNRRDGQDRERYGGRERSRSPQPASEAVLQSPSESEPISNHENASETMLHSPSDHEPISNPENISETVLQTQHALDIIEINSDEDEEDDQMAPRLRELTPRGHRKRISFTEEETRKILEGLRRFYVRGNRIPWKKIFEWGRHIFQKNFRTAKDLKDRWRTVFGRTWRRTMFGK